MDVIVELVKEFAQALSNPTTLLMVLALIFGGTYFMIRAFVRSKRVRKFFMHWFKSNENETNELAEMKAQFASLTAKFIAVIENLEESSEDNSDDVKNQLANAVLILQRDFAKLREENTGNANEVRDMFTRYEQDVDLMHQTHKDLLHHVLDVTTRLKVEVEKFDEYVRTVIPEFKADNKEINRGINELSKDIALIERTIQTQINSSGVTLR